MDKYVTDMGEARAMVQEIYQLIDENVSYDTILSQVKDKLGMIAYTCAKTLLDIIWYDKHQITSVYASKFKQPWSGKTPSWARKLHESDELKEEKIVGLLVQIFTMFINSGKQSEQQVLAADIERGPAI